LWGRGIRLISIGVQGGDFGPRGAIFLAEGAVGSKFSATARLMHTRSTTERGVSKCPGLPVMGGLQWLKSC
jgi:hypothetical protein